jgi:hypothetical protein
LDIKLHKAWIPPAQAEMNGVITDIINQSVVFLEFIDARHVKIWRNCQIINRFSVCKINRFILRSGKPTAGGPCVVGGA